MGKWRGSLTPHISSSRRKVKLSRNKWGNFSHSPSCFSLLDSFSKIQTSDTRLSEREGANKGEEKLGGCVRDSDGGEEKGVKRQESDGLR